MRLAFALVLATACGPKVSTQPVAFDEDLGPRPQAAPAAPVQTVRPEAPPGKGLRNGVIARDRLVKVLDAGAGQFLRQVEVTPRMTGERFVGWQLVQLIDRHGPLIDIDLLPGDVLLAVNGQPLARPDQLQALWDSLRTANTVTAQLWRGDAKFSLEFTVEPALPN
jgi:S1-C subfamily serine protease